MGAKVASPRRGTTSRRKFVTMKRLSILLPLLLLISCGEEEAIRIQLTPDQREEFQAIAAARIDTMRPIMDSLCTATTEARIAAATDSIIQVRLEEEIRLRTRLGQTTGR